MKSSIFILDVSPPQVSNGSLFYNKKGMRLMCFKRTMLSCLSLHYSRKQMQRYELFLELPNLILEPRSR